MTIEELNNTIENGTISDVIAIAEARQRKVLSQIADKICAQSGVRLVLLAGGSSSGKTTTAKRLRTQLGVNGREALLLSTDDYFVGDARNPRDENGELDYEHVECVDIPRLAADINALFAGEVIAERRFDFQRHEPTFSSRMLTLPKGGFVILEGIHALNPRLTEGIDDACKFRVLINPKPSLEVLPGLLPKSTEARFLRRMVRDNQFRKIDPVGTVRIWPKVLAGEQKWIQPFTNRADAVFDSYLVYEMAVLKFYVGGLLVKAQRTLGNVTEVTNMMRLLAPIAPIDATRVPGDSILRETIGGSQLEY